MIGRRLATVAGELAARRAAASSSSAGGLSTHWSGRAASCRLADLPRLRPRDRRSRPRARTATSRSSTRPARCRCSSLPALRSADYAGAFALDDGDLRRRRCVARRSRSIAARSRRAYVALAPVLVGSLILSRFDLWPALLLVAVLAALLGRAAPARVGAPRRRGRREALAPRRSFPLALAVVGRAAREAGAPLTGLAVVAVVLLAVRRRSRPPASGTA